MELDGKIVEFDVESLNESHLPLNEVGIPDWLLKSFGKEVKLNHIKEVWIRKTEEDNNWSKFIPRLKNGTHSYNWVALNPILGFYDSAMMQRDEPWLVARYFFVQGAPVTNF